MKAPVNYSRLADADIKLWPQFYTSEKADALFVQLRKELSWRHEKLKVFGKTYWQPRLTALYGEDGQSYTYSNLALHPLSFTEELQDIKEEIENALALEFSACLANLYRDGRDSMGWHSDDEKALGSNPVIASLSLGASRRFRLRRKDNHRNTCSIELSNGSLLLMQGSTQHFWQHQIPKTKKTVDERINLTFRKIDCA